MTPETSMRRETLITELLAVPLAGFRDAGVAPKIRRRSCRMAFILGLLMLAQGCQSGGSLSKYFGKPKSEDLSPEQKKSVLAILDGDKLKDKGGLPTPSQAKNQGESMTRLLDQGQESLAAYYSDGNPAHLTEAHRNYEQVLALEPGNAESHHGLAIVCDLQKDYPSAELHYRAALEEDPENGEILGNLGYSYILQGKFSDAEATLARATKLDPNNAQTIKNLGYVYAIQGDYNLAEATYRKVMNEVEVRQEMAQKFPQGRPDMARQGERGKLPWQHKDGLTTEEFKNRMDTARQQSMAEMRDKKSALEAASPEALSFEQQQIRSAQLQWEHDQALSQLEQRSALSSNTPIMIGPGTSQPGGPGMQLAPQGGQQPGYDLANQSSPGMSPTASNPINPPAYQQGRRVTNTFYPDRSSGAGNPASNPNGLQVQQASGQAAQPGPNGRTTNQYALHETDRGIDPRTGMPRNSGVQQTNGREPILVPNGLSTPEPNPQTSNPVANLGNGAGTAAFEDAKRRAAMAGMGGPEMMFNVPAINVPQVDGGNRLTPGTGSTWNGGQYPQPQRMLPMDAAPHDLNELMQAPSGRMTVEPNNMGMLNSPTGRSFANPNFQQPLNPQIPLDSPMGNQAMNYTEQTQTALRGNMPGSHDIRVTPSSPSRPIDPNRNTLPQDSYSGDSSGYDPRNSVNSSLNEYGQSFRHNPAEQNSNGWNQTPTPSYGLQNQPQAENVSQLMNRGWNQQEMTPRFTPPPYPGRPATGESDPAMNSGGGYSQGSDRTQGYEPSSYNPSSYSGGSDSFSAPAPAPIYSPGVRVPAEYGSGNRATTSYGQSFNGPRITPAAR